MKTQRQRQMKLLINNLQNIQSKNQHKVQNNYSYNFKKSHPKKF